MITSTPADPSLPQRAEPPILRAMKGLCCWACTRGNKVHPLPSLWELIRLSFIVMLFLAAAQRNLPAVQFQVLHSFPTNSYPQCTLVFGDDHALYGTTQMGG